jgi:trans-2,3-dihydro-3-hydroxyanthranilate isomerase
MKLKFHTLDVFTDKRFGGNPLAVVHDADGLSPQQMQTIAREFNLSETVFVLKAERPAHTARIRIFTPGVELPFAGHPTVGTGVLLAALRAPESTGDRDALVVLELAIGSVRVGVRQRPGKVAFAEFDLPKLPERGAVPPPADRIAQSLGLIPSEIGFENHKPTIYTAGVPFVFVPVATRDAIARADVQMQHWKSVFADPMPGGAFVYCRECVHNQSSFHARMFWPAAGVTEDPATGGAAAAFAGVVHTFDGPPDGLHKKVIEQGFEMGRPSLITLSLDVRAGKLASARIGGNAVMVSEGSIEV